jgi:hypothetical protein
MNQFEIEQVENSEVEYREREPGETTGFLNWRPTYEQMEINQDVPTLSIFTVAFKGHQEAEISFGLDASHCRTPGEVNHPLASPPSKCWLAPHLQLAMSKA